MLEVYFHIKKNHLIYIDHQCGMLNMMRKKNTLCSNETSLGCQFRCSFCMINVINRNDLDEIGVSSNYSGMRFWSPEFIFNEFKKLTDYGVETIRIVDEMFLLNQKYYLPLCKKLAELNKEKNLRMWAYSRVDTVKNPKCT